MLVRCNSSTTCSPDRSVSYCADKAARRQRSEAKVFHRVERKEAHRRTIAVEEIGSGQLDAIRSGQVARSGHHHGPDATLGGAARLLIVRVTVLAAGFQAR